jgi:hypothetical protein
MRDPDASDFPDPELEAWLSRHLPEAGEPATEGPGPDPSRVAGHLAGVGDESLLLDAARRPGVRRVLADVADAAAAAEESARHERGLSPGSRAEILAAFDAAVPAPAEAADDDGAEPAETEAAPRSRSATWARVAAAAVLLAGASLPIVLGPTAAAGPALPVDGIERADGAGWVSVEGPKRMSLGARLDAGLGERVAVELEGSGRVVLAGGARTKVGVDTSANQRPTLLLDEGAALLVAAEAPAGAPTTAGPRVLLHGAGWVEARTGASRASVPGPASTALARIDVPAGSTAAWGRTGSRPEEAVLLRGPGAFLVRREGPPEAGPVAEDALRELVLFGSVASPPPSERRTSSRFWRVLRGASPASRGAPAAAGTPADLDGQPAVRFDLLAGRPDAPASVARVAWLPDGEALAQDVLVVSLAARPAPGEAAAGGARPPRVRARAESSSGAVLSETSVDAVPADAGGAAPLRAVLALPAGWRDAVGGGEVVVALEAEDAGARVWFLGATFARRGGDDVPAPPAAEEKGK